MSITFHYDSPGEGYPDLLVNTMARGTRVSSRGGDTLELENVQIVFNDPSKAIHLKRPGFSPLLGLMEGVQLVGQTSRPVLMDRVWPKYAVYTDHHGDYGDRVEYGSQIEKVLRKFIVDPETRQAIISLWHPLQDNVEGYDDYPCTLNIGFRYRDGRLNMTVTMRSNDIWRGASSDFIQFALLHVTMAKLLGVPVGTYTHQAYSFHLYKNDIATAESWLARVKAGECEQYSVNTVRPLALDHGQGGWTYADTVTECCNTLSASSRHRTRTDMGKDIGTMLTNRQKMLEAKAADAAETTLEKSM